MEAGTAIHHFWRARAVRIRQATPIPAPKKKGRMNAPKISRKSWLLSWKIGPPVTMTINIMSAQHRTTEPPMHNRSRRMKFFRTEKLLVEDAMVFPCWRCFVATAQYDLLRGYP